MPFLKFTRDRRGYENTYLVEPVRRRGREQQRVLYWFRSPPQVKVGRAAIDEDAIRALEEHYPEIDFDWTRILEARPPEPEPDDARRVRRPARDREGRRESRREPQVSQPPAGPPEELAPAVEKEPIREAPAPAEARARLEVDAPPETSPAPAHEPAIGIEVDSGDEPPDVAPAVAHALEPSAAAEALGSEGLLRLRARYAEVCARIATQVPDDARRDTLRALAEQLNPDGWVTSADVRSGLEQFEQVLDQIRREVGPLRRRTRRGGRRNRRRRDPAGQSDGSLVEPGAESAEDDDTADEDDSGSNA